ncbi:MAG: transcriptional regulator NrdR [Firmicutes bacterium]|nr:transcriptional regulator NrdR [Bacillota bacterium]
MRCPFCGGESKVLESRPVDEGMATRRRRECLACGRRFTTMERVEEAPLVVVKKDGRREAFDRNKILAGVLRACEKRPVRIEDLERLVMEVEAELREGLEREVPSARIGELVMERLRHLDGVAYVRFASVYRQFKDVKEFREQLERLLSAEETGTPPPETRRPQEGR